MDRNHLKRSVPNSRTCTYCQAGLPSHTPPNINHCRALACQQAWQRENLSQIQRQEKEQRAQLNYRVEQFRALQSQELRTPTHEVVMVEVPYNDNTVVKQTDERRENFLQHLTHLISTLSEVETEDTHCAQVETPLAPHLGEALAQSCATCRGFCCLQGEHYHAFIQRSTLLRVMENEPELTTDNIVDHYASYIPDEAMQAGCVYQTETGCCLPSEYRANICHEFFCDGLRQYVSENSRKTPEYTVIIATDQNQPKSVDRISVNGEITPLKAENI